MKKLYSNLPFIIILLYIITPVEILFINLFKLPNFIFWYFPVLLAILYSLYIGIKNIKNIKKKEYILIIMLLLISIISSILAKDPVKSVLGINSCNDSLITFIGYLGFFLCAYKLTDISKQKILAKIFVFISSFIAILTLIRIPFISHNIFLIPKGEYYFYIGPFSFFNQFGAYLLFSAIISIFLFINTKKKEKIIYLITNIILIFTLVINDTFSVFLSFIVFLILLSLYLLQTKKNYKELLIIMIIFISTCLLASRDGYNVVKRNILGTISDTKIITNKSDGNDENNNIYSVGTGRGELWIHGIKYIIKKPLLGYGYENIVYEYKKDGITNPKPHNRYIEYAQNTGIPSLIIYIILMGSIIIKNIKIKNKNIIKVVALLFVITYLFNAIFSISFFNTTAYFYIFLGILSQKNYKEKRRKNEK